MENTEGAFKNGQSRKTDNKTQTQHNMHYTPLYASKHK